MNKTDQSSILTVQNKELGKLFDFLKKNHSHNRAFQLISLKSSVLPFETKKEKIRSLLVDAANTQSQANLDTLGDLWSVTANEKEGTFESATEFAAFLEKMSQKSSKKAYGNEEPSGLLEKMFSSLNKVPGLGRKTSALFIKNLVYLHHKDECLGYPNDRLGFWEDEDLQCINQDRIYIPVDSVIEHIFSKTTVGGEFVRINQSIHNFMNEKKKPMIEMLYWDDLWYWGFFTQRVDKDNGRTDKLNKPKFMSWKNSSPKSFSEVENHAHEFLEIVKGLRKKCAKPK